MQKNKIKVIMKIVFVIIGTIIGAGFASGKEIYSFFFRYGKAGIIGLIVSSSAIGLIIYKVFNICNKNKIKTYKKFCDYIGTEKFFKGEIIYNIINLFLIISFFVMIAGFSSFLNQEFSVNRVVGSSIILIISYFIFLKKINGLIKVSDYLVPLLIFFIVFISAKSIGFTNISAISNNANLLDLSGSSIFIAIIKSVLYASFNCVVLIPVLIPLRTNIKSKKESIILSGISVFIIILLSLSVFVLLLQGNGDIYKLEMPAIGIVNNNGKVLAFLYRIIIGISILTSAISAGCGFLNNCSKDEKSFKRNLAIMLILAVFISQISFSAFVELLFPVLGFIGMIELILILRKG